VEDRLAEKLALLEARGMVLIVEREGRVVLASPQSRLVALATLLRDRPEEMRSATVIDKVIGAAAAKLCVHGGAAEVFAGLASEAGLEVLRAAGIPAAAREVVPLILNRDRSDLCPMERMSREITAPAAFYQTLIERIAAAQ
jgi:hypothetical protein